MQSYLQATGDIWFPLTVQALVCVAIADVGCIMFNGHPEQAIIKSKYEGIKVRTYQCVGK